MTERDEHNFFVLCLLYHKMNALGQNKRPTISTIGGASAWKRPLKAIGREEFGINDSHTYSKFYNRARQLMENWGYRPKR